MKLSTDARGQLDLLLLSVLAGGPAHGYRVIEQLRAASGGSFDLPEGTVYPALHRLERGGLLESRWSEEASRRRRVYAITDRGRGALEGRRREWTAFMGAMQSVVAR
jgi:PadR family transcriptional regulator, regulatory protein PadR